MVTVDQTEPSAEVLVAKCQAGCRDSFELLVEQYEQRVFSFLCQMVGNIQDAEDLTQDTFVKVYRNIQSYDSHFKFTTWLFTIAKRTAANHFRAAKNWEPLPEEPEIVDPETPCTLLERKDDRDSVWDLAKKLKPDQYEVLWLRYGEGFSVRETAKIMRTNSIRVRVLLHRARHQLAKMLTLARAVVPKERPI